MNTRSARKLSEALRAAPKLLAVPSLALALALAFRFGIPAHAQSLDPTLPQRRVVGSPAGASPMDRVTPERTGRASEPLPQKPRVLWRARVAGGIEPPILVDQKGRIVIAGSAGQLSQLDRSGKPGFTFRLGAPPLGGPVLTSDGTRAILTTLPELVAVDDTGKLVRRRALPFARVRTSAAALPLDDGSLVLALGGSVLRVDSNGELSDQTNVESDVRSLLLDGRSLLIATLRGEVFEWSPPAAAQKLGSFGGAIDGAALCGAGRVCAVADGSKLVELRLGTAMRHVRIPDNLLALRGPPAVLPSGETRLATLDGVLLGHDSSGRETLRVGLEPTIVLGDAGAPPLAAQSSAPPLVVDASGRVGFVRPWLEAGTVSTDGEIATAAGAACGDPVSLAPAGRGRLVVACRSGSIWMIGD